MINLFDSEFTNIVIDNNEKEIESIIHLIDYNINSILKDLSREANKTNIVSTVMNPDVTKYYIDDYLRSIQVGELKGSLHLLAFNHEIIKETIKSSPKDIYSQWVIEEKPSIKLLDKKGSVGFSVPVRYNNYTEGYLVYKTKFSLIFSETIKQLDFLAHNHNHQFKAYIEKNIISQTKHISDENLSYMTSLASVPITIEILTPKSVIQKSINRLGNNLIIIAIIFSLIGIFILSFLTSKSIASPLNKLKSDIDNASNSHDEIVTFKKRTANEIVIVGRAFNKMHQRLLKRSELLEKKNKELKSTQEQLIQNEKMASIGQLAAGVAHEINNPTGFVKTNLETMKEYNHIMKQLLNIVSPLIYDTGESKFDLSLVLEKLQELNNKENLKFIFDDIDSILTESLDGTQRIQKIVQGLRNFARQDKETLIMGNINTPIENAINLARNEIKYKCKIHKKLGSIPDNICNIDQLTQVFVNLLINASHAIDEQGDIYIISKYKNGKIIIKIADNGVGIPKEYLSKLFEPFFSTKETGKGTGLGLAISLGIIEKHNGTIEVSSKLGHGTCFTIKIPAFRT